MDQRAIASRHSETPRGICDFCHFQGGGVDECYRRSRRAPPVSLALVAKVESENDDAEFGESDQNGLSKIARAIFDRWTCDCSIFESAGDTFVRDDGERVEESMLSN